MKLLSTTVKHSLRNCHPSPVEQEKHRAPTSEIAKTTNFGEPLTTSHVSNLKEIADSQRGGDNPYYMDWVQRLENVTNPYGRKSSGSLTTGMWKQLSWGSLFLCDQQLSNMRRECNNQKFQRLEDSFSSHRFGHFRESPNLRATIQHSTYNTVVQMSTAYLLVR